jgi:hypothetical protein
MAKLPKLPKLKVPKLPKMKGVKAPKLPKLKTPKMPSSVKGAASAALLTAQSIRPGYVITFLYIIPIILGIVTFSKVGIFGAGVLVFIFNSLGFLLALIGIILTGISTSMNDFPFYKSVIGLIVTIFMTSYSLHAATNYTYTPEKKEEEVKKE